MSKEKVKKKRISGKAYDINKQTIYIVPKSKLDARAHYARSPHGVVSDESWLAVLM